MTDAQERAFELIAQADKVETICLLAIAHVITGAEVDSMAKQTKGTLKKAIKRMREAQSRHPEISEFEEAIKYIRQFIQAGKEATV